MNTIIRQEQQEFFDTGLTLDYHFRMEMLLRFKEMMNQNKDKIAKTFSDLENIWVDYEVYEQKNFDN